MNAKSCECELTPRSSKNSAMFLMLLDERVRRVLVELLGTEPLAVRTMVYVKAAGGARAGRRRAYRDRHRGCGKLSGTERRQPLVHLRDRPGPGRQGAVDAVMCAEDVLFFHGNLIHGSEPNTTADRSRTSGVSHSSTAQAERVPDYYPVGHAVNGNVVAAGRR